MIPTKFTKGQIVGSLLAAPLAMLLYTPSCSESEEPQTEPLDPPKPARFCSVDDKLACKPRIDALFRGFNDYCQSADFTFGMPDYNARTKTLTRYVDSRNEIARRAELGGFESWTCHNNGGGEFWTKRDGRYTYKQTGRINPGNRRR